MARGFTLLEGLQSEALCVGRPCGLSPAVASGFQLCVWRLFWSRHCCWSEEQRCFESRGSSLIARSCVWGLLVGLLLGRLVVQGGVVRGATTLLLLRNPAACSKSGLAVVMRGVVCWCCYCGGMQQRRGAHASTMPAGLGEVQQQQLPADAAERHTAAPLPPCVIMPLCHVWCVAGWLVGLGEAG